MKRRINNLFLLLALIAALGLIPAGQVTAQTFTILHSFAKIDLHTGDNSDGDYPNAGLIVSGNTLYGTAWDGGTSDAGTVFKVNTDGTGFKTLSSLTPVTEPNAPLVLSSNTLYGTAREGFLGLAGEGAVFRVKTDGTGFTILHNFAGGNGGANPLASLVLSGTTLYGTTSDLYLDAPYSGTVFKINTDGTGFATLHSFMGADGDPEAGLVIISGNTLYGTTSGGGGFGMGSVFAVNTDGTGFTNLYSFTGGSDGGRPGNGGEPGPDGGDGDGLILSGNTLYGVTTLGSGTVFAVNTDGTGFTTLYDFTGGSNGVYPSGLSLSGNTLYGTAGQGGSLGSGTVFAVNTDGTGFTNLHTFTALSNSTNSDGAYPYGLILAGNTLCGFSGGGSLGNGTVFKVNTDGTGFTSLYSFTAPSGPYPETNSDGADPGGLILSGNTLYGTAGGGGSSGSGTVFSLTLPPPPPLTIIPLGADVILTWPTNAAGLALQSTTNLLSPAVWTSVSTQPVVVNGQNTVTNPITGSEQFYRLSQ
jgi:uncharacterized repeat protein (TIGR03803 family)